MFPSHIDQNGNIQTSTEHSQNTAFLAGSHLASINLENLGYLAGLLHDCGKFTEDFTDYIQRASKGLPTRKGEVIHSFAGVRMMLRDYRRQCPLEQASLTDLTAELIALAVGSHHGLFDCIDPDGNSGFDHRFNRQPSYDDKAISHFHEECASKDDIGERFRLAAEEINLLVPRLRTISKRKEILFYLSLTARLLTSAVVDGDRTDTAAFLSGTPSVRFAPPPSLWEGCLNTLETHLCSFHRKTNIDDARQELSELCRKAGDKPTGLFRLNIPTGGGKTLSGLRFALRHAIVNGMKRVILLSPLLSILEQNAKAVRKALNNDSIILEHHSNVINDASDDELTTAYSVLTETWDSPIVISTLVQFLDTLFSGKMSAVRRFHSLTDSVIIIDEVQTVPSKMLSLFNLAVNYLTTVCHTTVVLCSATQPEFRSLDHGLRGQITDIIPSEVIKKYASVFQRTKIKSLGQIPEEDIQMKIAELFNGCNSLLAICNKKREAERLFRSLKNSIQKGTLYHLSAGMCQRHREDTVEAVKQALLRKESILCVSTQVVEAGVDLSFEAVVRYSAGMDSIVQAAGRCNRNGESATPAPVYIIDCPENLSRLPEIQKAKSATGNLLYDFGESPQCFGDDLQSDASLSAFYHYFYAEMASNHFDYPLKDAPSLYEMLSDNRTFITEKYRYQLAQSFKTAGEEFEVLDSNGISVIVPYRDGEHIMEEIEQAFYAKADMIAVGNLIGKAKPYVVTVPKYQFDGIRKKGGIKELADERIYLLDKAFYDDSIGVLSDEKEEYECNILIK